MLPPPSLFSLLSHLPQHSLQFFEDHLQILKRIWRRFALGQTFRSFNKIVLLCAERSPDETQPDTMDVSSWFFLGFDSLRLVLAKQKAHACISLS
jgi:hypothetical protein